MGLQEEGNLRYDIRGYNVIQKTLPSKQQGSAVFILQKMNSPTWQISHQRRLVWRLISGVPPRLQVSLAWSLGQGQLVVRQKEQTISHSHLTKCCSLNLGREMSSPKQAWLAEEMKAPDGCPDILWEHYLETKASYEKAQSSWTSRFVIVAVLL